ncbi:MAG: hypothetical protein J5659_06375 [Clostridia bacterium]|nr:hypothetical protein [Clostridia bacterium]
MTRKVLNPITAATIIVIMYMTMPILSVFVSAYITTYAYMLLALFLMCFILLSGGISRLSSIIYVLFPFMIHVLCTYFTSESSTLLWGYQSMLFLLPVIIGYYYFYHKPENAYLLTIIVVFSLAVTVITTIVGLIQFPFAARTLATISESDDPENIKYAWHNIGGYDFIYTSVLLYPVIILSYKLKKIKLPVFLIIATALFALIVLSEYATALILFLLSSLLYLVGKNIGARQLLMLGVLFFLVIFFLWPIISNLFLWLADIFNSDVLKERLTALAGGITGLENSESKRIELYEKSIQGFLSSPIFGKMMGSEMLSGGHSFILDSLANYGIIGGAALFFAYKTIYKCFFKPFNNCKDFGFVLWAFAQAIILSIINTGMWLNVLTLFIPVLLSFIYNLNSEDNYENSLGN